MGLFGDILGGIGKIATSIIPGPVDDLIFEGAKGLFGGGSKQAAPRKQVRTTAPFLPQPVGVGRIQTRTQQQQPAPINLPGPIGGRGFGFPQPFAQAGRVSIGEQSRNGRSIPMAGAFGVEPEVVSVRTRRCPRGAVLAIDGLCYPKQMVPRTFREWKPDPRPVVSRSDQKAIRKANAAKKRLVKLTKQAGAHASMTKPRRSSKASSNGRRPIVIAQND